MSKKKKLTVIIPSVIFVLAILGIFFINNSNKTNLDVTKADTKVGILLNGSARDYSWGQSHMEGLNKAAKNLNLHVIYAQYTAEGEGCKPQIEEFIKLGCRIIIGNSFGFGEAITEMSEKYPDVYFFHATGLNYSKNLTSYFGRIYQIRYLTGIVAGLQTDTNEIGYVAAMSIPEVNRGINAFTLGVRSVNPDAKVYVKWTGSWAEVESTTTATYELLSDRPNIDVLAMHTDSQRVLEIAEELGIWTIGYNRDNYMLYPNTFLTAPVWNWENFYEPQILSCLQGKFVGKHYWFDLDSGITDMAPLSINVKPGIQEVVSVARAKLESGVWDVFYGPIYDNQGVLRVMEDENLSDETMLDYFDWFVDGVYIDE